MGRGVGGGGGGGGGGVGGVGGPAWKAFVTTLLRHERKSSNLFQNFGPKCSLLDAPCFTNSELTFKNDGA